MPVHTDPDTQETVLKTYQDMVKEITSANQICICNQIRYFYARAVEGMGASYQGGVRVFDGAHVVLDDGGYFYGLWKSYLQENINSFKPNGRISSHYDGGKGKGGTIAQYEIVFPNKPSNWGGMLFGLHMTKGSGGWVKTTPLKTWFQMEAAPLDDFKGHAVSTVKYFGTVITMNKQNIGPKGKSVFSDTNPLVVPKVDIDCFHPSDWSPNG